MGECLYVVGSINWPRSWQATPMLRWLIQDDSAPELQQAWRCVETGEMEWRKVQVEIAARSISMEPPRDA